MSYKEFIDNILNTRGRFACSDEYKERHHIVPKCMGGTNDEDNLIDLYAKEHFEAHRLLALENPENDSLIYAWWMMAHMKTNKQVRYEVTAEEYEKSRRAYADLCSKRYSGKGNPRYGQHCSEETRKKIGEAAKGRIVSEETRRKMSESHKGISTWNKGVKGLKHSEETKKKIGEAHKGRIYSKETLVKMSNSSKKRFENKKNHPMYGKKHSTETKDKIRIKKINKLDVLKLKKFIPQ